MAGWWPEKLRLIFCKRRFHLVLHLADQLILAHAFMIERLGIAFAESLQVRTIKHPALHQLGKDNEQAVGVGDIAGDERLVDHRQTRRILVLFFDVTHAGSLDDSGRGATPA
jgi:hypothetical protein